MESDIRSNHTWFPASGKSLSMILVAATLMAACGGGANEMNSAPVANAGPDQNVTTGSVLTLDGSASTDPNGDLLTYGWRLMSKPAGSAATLSSTTEVRPTFTADRNGVFVVSLVVNDGKADSAADTVTITTSVVNTPPVANAGPDQTVTLGSVVALDGSGSTDADGDVLHYSWSFVSKPAGTTAFISNMSSAHPTFPADRNGDYVISLRITDLRGSESLDTMTVTVWTPPTAPRANSGLNRSVITGTFVALDGSKSADANGDSLTYRWSMTSKPAGSTAALSGSTSAHPSFTSDRDGVYVISLVVNDGSLDSPIDTVTITSASVVVGISLPVTGYTVSYAVGDDGYYHKGVVWPFPRFTDLGDGSVTDRLTGLMWLKESNCIQTKYPAYDADGVSGDGYVTWQHALDFVKGINDGTYPGCGAGYTDWHLPNIKELSSLFSYSAQTSYGVMLPDGHPFNCAGLDKVLSIGWQFWTSTTYVGEGMTNNAWRIDFSDFGSFSQTPKVYGSLPWPVRESSSAAPAKVSLTGQTKCYDSLGIEIACAGTGQDGDIQAGVPWPSPRFIVGSGTEAGCVTDRLTGLMWPRSPDGIKRYWSDALLYAEALSLCGYTDWRLPNINEITSLANADARSMQWLEGEGFLSVQTGLYWSSTASVIWLDPSWKWFAYIPLPHQGKGDTGYPEYTWSVRGGR